MEFKGGIQIKGQRNRVTVQCEPQVSPSPADSLLWSFAGGILIDGSDNTMTLGGHQSEAEGLDHALQALATPAGFLAEGLGPGGLATDLHAPGLHHALQAEATSAGGSLAGGLGAEDAGHGDTGNGAIPTNALQDPCLSHGGAASASAVRDADIPDSFPTPEGYEYVQGEGDDPGADSTNANAKRRKLS